ncbi:uncharacterized protein B0P05DRAFT_527959, partial [Gilbertella persicaria]|uniref:uncharacterized protein n=1 Tax=Gilbertella persicaria TaxID=101096 RepID=UPI00221F81D3
MKLIILVIIAFIGSIVNADVVKSTALNNTTMSGTTATASISINNPNNAKNAATKLGRDPMILIISTCAAYAL